jgi:hypothetical protein
MQNMSLRKVGGGIMKKKIVSYVSIIFLLAFCFQYAGATDVAVTFTTLTGLTGGTSAGTAVFRAEITGLTSLQSITITDNSFGLGGAPGQFSGLILMPVVVLHVCCNCGAAQTLAGLSFLISPLQAPFLPGANGPADPGLNRPRR